MSLKEYKELNEEIAQLYGKVCLPCLKGFSYRKGDCKVCPTMEKYTKLQEKKKSME